MEGEGYGSMTSVWALAFDRKKAHSRQYGRPKAEGRWPRSPGRQAEACQETEVREMLALPLP